MQAPVNSEKYAIPETRSVLTSVNRKISKLMKILFFEICILKFLHHPKKF